ncbi:MAG: hypothetical protein AB9846_09505 [Tenuifilaceae bacterium]
MKRALIFFLLGCFGISAFAQRVTDISFKQEQNKIIITYRIANIRYDRKYFTTAYISTDGGKTSKPIKATTGDVGEISPDGIKTITWSVFDEYESLEGDISFDIRLKMDRIPLPRKTFIIYSMSSIAPFGVTIGSMRRFGWYFSVRTNGTFNVASDFSTDNDDLTDYTGDGYYKFTDEVKRARYSFHVGASYRATNFAFLYAGAGYGSRHLFWQVTEYSYTNDMETGTYFVDHIDFSHNGPEVEAGLQLMLKKFTFGVGINSMGFKKNEIVGSIGFVF